MLSIPSIGRKKWVEHRHTMKFVCGEVKGKRRGTLLRKKRQVTTSNLLGIMPIP